MWDGVIRAPCIRMWDGVIYNSTMCKDVGWCSICYFELEESPKCISLAWGVGFGG